jgi:hypothetical protein
LARRFATGRFRGPKTAAFRAESTETAGSPAATLARFKAEVNSSKHPPGPNDTDWSHGEGAEVSGPIVSLVMAMTGRKGALADLSGDGVDTLSSRAQTCRSILGGRLRRVEFRARCAPGNRFVNVRLETTFFAILQVRGMQLREQSVALTRVTTCPGRSIEHADGSVIGCTLGDQGCRGPEADHHHDPIRCRVWTPKSCNYCGVARVVRAYGAFELTRAPAVAIQRSRPAAVIANAMVVLIVASGSVSLLGWFILGMLGEAT